MPVLEAIVEKKANHQANIVKIHGDMIFPHPDPETTNLELIYIGQYQVVVRKGEFKIGDLGVYIQPDSVVPQTEPFKFIWEPYVGTLDAPHIAGHIQEIPTVSEKRRRITVRKFRGQWSEGLLLPVSDFPELNSWTHDSYGISSSVGDDVSDFLGITHYNPDSDEATRGNNEHGPKAKRPRYPKTIYGWFRFLLRKLFPKNYENQNEDNSLELPTYDVKAFQHGGKGAFEGEQVVVTEKIHGSNARFVFFEGKMYAGSRNFWKSPSSNCVWRKALQQNPWIEEWCRAHEGHALYGEVTPTQWKFTYGCKEGEVKFFVFDIRRPDGKWADYGEFSLEETASLTYVPQLYFGPYDHEKVKKLVDGTSWVKGAGHIREGVVIKTAKEKHVRGIGRAQLKIVSNDFLAKDSKNA